MHSGLLRWNKVLIFERIYFPLRKLSLIFSPKVPNVFTLNIQPDRSEPTVQT